MADAFIKKALKRVIAKTENFKVVNLKQIIEICMTYSISVIKNFERINLK